MELKGLKINFLGDSITQGCGTSNEKEKRFSTLLEKDYGIIGNNYGIGGTRIARQQRPLPKDDPCSIWDMDYCLRMKDMDKTADAVMVFGGTNDFGHGDAPFGCFEDRTPDTFYGACHYMMSYLEGEYAGKPVIIITPLHRSDEDILEGKYAVRPLKAYVDALKEVAEYYSLPVLDFWKESGLTPKVPAILQKYMPDGLHPNDEGHILLADKIASFLKAL